MTTCKHDEKNTAHMTDAAAGHAPGQTPAINSGSTPGLVSFVGAGPGDPGLITVKGLSCLKACDAVVYDSLSSEQLLAAASNRRCSGISPACMSSSETGSPTFRQKPRI